MSAEDSHNTDISTPTLQENNIDNHPESKQEEEHSRANDSKNFELSPNPDPQNSSDDEPPQIADTKELNSIDSKDIAEENGTQSQSSPVQDKPKTEEPKDSITKLEHELEQAVRYRDTVKWSVTVLEHSIKELEAELQRLQEGPGEQENEYKLRYEAQKELNNKLEEQLKDYQSDVGKMKDRAKPGQENTHIDDDLEKLSEFELAKLVKHLERERNALYGDLRNKSWLLDSQSKDYHRAKELIKAYTGDLNIVNRSLEQIWRKKSREEESTFLSIPFTTPGSLYWSSAESGIRPSRRILDPKKGPIRKTVGIRSLPRLDQEDLDNFEGEALDKRRTKSLSNNRARKISSLGSSRKDSKSDKGTSEASSNRISLGSTTEASEEHITIDSFSSSAT